MSNKSAPTVSVRDDFRLVLRSGAATFSRGVLRGVGQIYLQRSAWCGLACLAALALQSVPLALACLLGALTATWLGRTFQDPPSWDDGLQGYNGALAGLGILVVLAPSLLAWCLVPLSSLAATWLAQLWRRHLALPPYTAPFVLVTWLCLALAGPLGLTLAAPAHARASWGFVADGILRGVGQVIFLDHPGAAALCVLGLALSGLRVAACALTAAALALGCAHLLAWPTELAALGLYGFNAVLTVEALRPWARRRSWLLGAGVALSIAVTRGFQLAHLPSLTAPFILSTWLLRGLTAGLTPSGPGE